MNTQHTPGPWHIDERGYIRAERGDIVGETFWNPQIRADGCQANNRLIAAAPDLLAALRNLVGFIDYHELTAKNPRLAIQLSEARAAIAKAEGV